MKHFLWIGIALVIVLGVGLWIGRSSREPSAYDLERMALKLEFSRRLLPFRITFWVLLGTVVLGTLGGLGWAGIRWILRRADTVYPDRAGLYPLRQERIGRATVFHDPNRTLTGTTVYSTGRRAIAVQHALPGGLASAQQQVTGQAQAAQALRAAVSGPMPLPSSQSVPFDLFHEQRISQPLPQVKELGYEPSHIERLLLEDGEVSG